MTRERRLKRQRHGRGFTLVEGLVAMALLSVIALALVGVMRGIAQTESRLDAKLASADEMRVTAGLLRRIVERVILPPSGVSGRGVPGVKQFDGKADALSWTGIMPAGYGASGRHRFLLRSEVLQDGAALILRFVPAQGPEQVPDWTRSDSRVMVKDLVGLRIDYLDDRREPPVVLGSWPSTNSLPSRVVLRIQTAAGIWPDMVLPVRLASAPVAGSGPFVAGARE